MVGSATATSSDKTVAIYDVKAENRDVTIRTLKVTMTESAAAGIASAIRLYDGSTLLASIAGTGTGTNPATFSNLSIVVAKDTTKTLTIKADLKPLAAGGETLQATITGNATNVAAFDSQDNVLGAKSCGGGECVTGTAIGKTLTAYTKAPTFALATANITKTTQAGSDDVADATITFNVTANGGDIYINKTGKILVAAASGTNTAGDTPPA